MKYTPLISNPDFTVLKTAGAKAPGGSNPSLSASFALWDTRPAAHPPTHAAWGVWLSRARRAARAARNRSFLLNVFSDELIAALTAAVISSCCTLGKSTLTRAVNRLSSHGSLSEKVGPRILEVFGIFIVDASTERIIRATYLKFSSCLRGRAWDSLPTPAKCGAEKNTAVR